MSKVAAEDSRRATSLDSEYVRGYMRAGKALLCMGRLEEVFSLYY